MYKRQVGGEASLHHVDQQRGVHLGGDPLDLPDVLRSFDEEDIGARGRVAARPVDCFVDAQWSAGVRTGDDHKVVVGACLEGGVQLLGEFLGGDELLVGQVAALFRECLVLQVEGCYTGLLVFTHGARDVHRCAVAGVGVGDERDAVECGDHDAGPVGHLALGEQPDVGQAEPGDGHPCATEVSGAETGAGHEVGGQAVEHARGGDQAPLGE